MQRKLCIAGLLAALFTAASASAAQVETTGFLKFEYWVGMDSGTAVILLQDYIGAGNKPNITSYVSAFNSRPVFPDDSHEQFGATISGWLTPAESGDYRFFIYSDDASELWLSTDATEANLGMIAQETGCCNNFTEPGTARTSEPVSLVAGKKYFIKLYYKEGGGGDYGQVAWRKEGDTTPAGALTPIPGRFLSSQADGTGASVTVTTQPQAVTVPANNPSSLSVAATAATPFLSYPSSGNVPLAPFYQWYKDGAVIPGANASTYSLTFTKTTDAGKYKCAVVVPGFQQFSDEVALTVASDVTPPTITKAGPDSTFTAVLLSYSEPVSDTAIDKANYALDGGVTVASVARVSATAVKLTTSRMAAGTVYTLTVNGVQDTGTPANNIAAGTKVTFKSFIQAAGFVLHKFWSNMNNNSIAGLTGDARFPDAPSWVSVEPRWEYGPDGSNESGSSYGNQLVGWFTPAKSGNYIFFTCSDDPSNLYLSTDDTPANKKLIAQETGWSNARTWIGVGSGDATAKRSDTFATTEWPNGNTITLTAGKSYYMESLHTEGGGGDSVSATFIMEGEADPVNGDAPKLTGSLISTYMDPNGAAVSITQQPASLTQEVGKTATLTVVATGTSAYGPNVKYQWQKAASGSSTFADIAGATAASYTTPVLALADNGTKYQVNCTVPTLTVASAQATLTVIADTKPAQITKVKATSVGTIVVSFNEALDQASAGAVANYSLSGGASVTKATASDTSVLLTVSGLTVKQAYVLTVGGVKDLYNNAIPAGTTFSFTANVVTYADVILADGPIGFYRFEETTGQTTKNYGSAGSAADGLYMAGSGPDSSVPTDAVVGEGPRPGQFLGFDPNNRSVLMDGPTSMMWIDTQKQFLNNLKAFSLEYWVKPANRVSDPAAFGTRIGLVGQNDAVEYGFINQTTIQIWSAGGGSLDTTYNFADGEWHHIATIADGSSIKNYYDGVLVGTGGSATSSYGSSVYNVHIGGGGVYDATGNFFTGQFDEVAIFDKAIPAARVAAHFKAGKEGGEAPSTPPVFKAITVAGGNATISWTGDGILEESATVNGGWTTSASQANPQTVPATGAKFYRLRQ